MRWLAGESVALVLQARVAFDFFEFFTDLVASHQQGSFELPALPAVVHDPEGEECECDLQDKLQRAGAQVCKLGRKIRDGI